MGFIKEQLIQKKHYQSEIQQMLKKSFDLFITRAISTARNGLAPSNCNSQWDLKNGSAKGIKLFHHAPKRFTKCLHGYQKWCQASWRDGSMVKNACCSYRGARFSFKHPHGGSKPPITSILGDQCPFWPPQAPRTHMVHVHTCMQAIHSDTQSKINKSNKKF